MHRIASCLSVFLSRSHTHTFSLSHTQPSFNNKILSKHTDEYNNVCMMSRLPHAVQAISSSISFERKAITSNPKWCEHFFFLFFYAAISDYSVCFFILGVVLPRRKCLQIFLLGMLFIRICKNCFSVVTLDIFHCACAVSLTDVVKI